MIESLSESGERIQTALSVQCGHHGCRRSCFAIELTPKGLALSVKSRHDGEWHTTRISLEMIQKVLSEQKLW